MRLGVRTTTGAAEVESGGVCDHARRLRIFADNSEAAGRNRSDFPELDCLRALLPPRILENAEDRATRLGIGADQILIASDEVDEQTYLRRLGASLDIELEPLTDVPRSLCPLKHERLINCNIDGLLLLETDDGIQFVLAPRETQARWLTKLIRCRPSLAEYFRLATIDQLNRYIQRCAGSTLLANAAHSLRQRRPELSAGPPRRFGQFISALIVSGFLLVAVSLITQASVVVIVEFIVTTFFLTWMGLRVASFFVSSGKIAQPTIECTDANLPVYTIIAALYDEAKLVDELLRNFEQFNYPFEKLDVIFAIEQNDHATRQAIEARKTRIPIRVVICPDTKLRTKPKALNFALPFARGRFTVIYDAEDRPDENQLRRALGTFESAGDDLVCVQAQLRIDNFKDSWLTRFFAVEYAGHFEVFLAGLAKLRLPLPLGGSSNHFRTNKLREIGGWDPYNVTEDADLGIRLVRFGYRSDIIFSTTDEEAPALFQAWLRQRTRWFKGWMQTWAVHMRHPLKLMHELGVAGFITFQLVVGGNVFAALAHPLLLIALAGTAVYDVIRGYDFGFIIFTAKCTAFLGYAPSIFIGLCGLFRRKLLSIAPILLLTPVHWVLLSFAAWRALGKFIFKIYEWEKTEHGLAKTSQHSVAQRQSMIYLRDQLQDIETAGKLPALADNNRLRSFTLKSSRRARK